MLLDTGKLGVLRDIELTDFRSVLRFMCEYPNWKNEQQHDPKTYVPGDMTDFA
jgi:hypothetical protein